MKREGKPEHNSTFVFKCSDSCKSTIS